LIETLELAIDKSDWDACLALERAASTIGALRTCEAFGSRCVLDSNDVTAQLHDASQFIDDPGQVDMPALTKQLTEPFQLEVNTAIRPSEYFEVAANYREEISAVIDALTSDARGNVWGTATELTRRLGELNSEVSKLRSSKRYLAYRATVGFLRSNKGMIGTALVAGTLGLAGSLVGCGTVTAVGIVGKVLRRKGHLKASPETRSFLEGIKKAVRPKMHKVLSLCTGISLPAVQLHEVTQDMKTAIRHKTAFRKKPGK
jgi:hypothetical protein